MAEKRQYAFASPELHWLNNPLGSSHGRMRNALVRNLLSISVNRDNETRQLVDHGNSSKPSPHLPKSHGASPNGKDTTKHNDFLVTLATLTAVAPIERVYILMQCQKELIKAGRLSTPYRGMEDCFRRTIKHEGVLSLWRDYARVRLATDMKAAGPLKFSVDVFGNDLRKRQFNATSDVYKKTLQLDGIRGLDRGMSVACIGHIAHLMTKRLGPAEFLNEKHNQKKPTLLALMLFDFSARALFYPFDTVSQRMMMTSGEASKYRGAMDAFYQIVKTEGVSSLFKGATPYMIHSFVRLWAFGFVSMTFSVLQTPAK